jgi:hypothetical protein
MYNPHFTRLERGRTMCNKGRAHFRHTMGERELEVGHQELLDVWTANVRRLLNFNHAEDLPCPSVKALGKRHGRETYVDRPETGTMPGRHVLIKTLDSVCTGQLTELFVHVVGTRPRVVPEPNPKVLHLQRLLLVNLNHQKVVIQPLAIPSACLLDGCKGYNTHDIDTNDFTIGFLNLLQLPERMSSCLKEGGAARTNVPQEVPEAGFGDYLVRCKYAHAVDFRSRVRLGGQVTPYDLVFLKTHLRIHISMMSRSAGVSRSPEPNPPKCMDVGC